MKSKMTFKNIDYVEFKDGMVKFVFRDHQGNLMQTVVDPANGIGFDVQLFSSLLAISKCTKVSPYLVEDEQIPAQQ